MRPVFLRWRPKPATPLGDAWRVLGETFSSWLANDAFTLAASISYYAIFSLAPVVVISLAVAAFFLGRHGAEETVLAQARDILGDKGANLVHQMIVSSRKPGHGLTASTIGLAVLLFGASGVFLQLNKAFDRIWDIPRKDLAGVVRMLRRRLFSFTMVLLVGILLLASLGLSTAVAAAGHYLEVRFAFWQAVNSLLGTTISLTLFFFLFAFLFKLLPEVDLAWRYVWAGAGVSAVLFDLGRSALALYLAKASVTSTFGAAGSLVAVLLWIFYGALSLLLGAEFTRSYTRLCREREGLPADPPRKRKRW